MAKDAANHDSKGRFAKGNKAAAGNAGGRKPRAIEQKLLDEFHRVVTVERWGIACSAILKLAENGNISAWAKLAPYAVGQPPVRVDVEVTPGKEILSAFEETLERVYGSFVPREDEEESE